MAQLLPTKGNLVAAKRSRALALTGYDLMSKKRNVLMAEMVALLDEAKGIQEKIDTAFSAAYRALAAANARMGMCAQLAQAMPLDDGLEIQYRSVMGVELPHIPHRPASLHPAYSLTNTSAALDEARAKFQEAKVLICRLAEVETSVYRLAQAVGKTRKRANALQNIVIPGLDRSIRQIVEVLEEKEREEFVRLKVIKETAETT